MNYKKGKLRKTIPFTIATRKIKLHEDKFNQTFKNLYLENYSTLKNEIEEDTNK